MVSERLKALRDRVTRREKKIRANRRAKSRRIEKEEPESTTEAAQVKAKQAKREAEMSAEEARKLASDAKTLVSTELGVSRSESEGIIKRGSELLTDAGDQVDQLDFDGDGDTDVLNVLDSDEELGLTESKEGQGGIDSIEAVKVGDDGIEPIFDPFEEGPK